MKSALRAAIAVGLVLLVVAVGVISAGLGRIIKTAVETVGPRVLGAPVSLASVTLAPWSGSGALHGLVLGNPPGFKGPHAVSGGEVRVRVRLSSLMTDTVVVEEVVVRSPDIAYEVSGGGSNLSRLQKNAEESAARLGAGKAAAEPSGKPAKSLLIRDFLLTGAQVGVSAPGMAGKEVRVPLPDVHLTDLGGKGQSSARAAARVLNEVSASAVKAVSSVGAKSIEAAVGTAAKGIGALGGLFKRK